jgi:hypothetical protein
MTFEEAFALDIGTVVTVADGSPQPSGGLGDRRYNQWRSHNFTGPILEKNGVAPFRSLLIGDAGSTYQVKYLIEEWVSHTFT